MAGPSDRDLTLGPHRYFRTLAHGLAQKGIATLRFDVRGAGASGGDLLTTHLQDRAADACQAVQALRNQLPDAVPSVGLIGMSEGGGIGLLTTAQ